jgi:D-glycero-D-manno-heptose 1,7-bisphosphate phosphatase
MVVDSLLEIHGVSLDGRAGVLEVSNRVVLLDRDGVLNVDRTDSVKSLEELEVIAGVDVAAAALAAAGYLLLVVTNQSVVGRGLLDLDTLHAINSEIDRRLGNTLRGFYVCPHTPEIGCACRKPGTRLLDEARVAWPFDPAQTWFVADADRDLEAARRAGVRPALVRTGKGAATERDHPDVPVWDDLAAFSDWLLAQP